jgi:transcriptional regulator with XRE-family HTH domain
VQRLPRFWRLTKLDLCSTNTLVMKTPLQLARERSGLTQAEAAAGIGMDRSYYGRIENARFKAHADLAKKIAVFFGLPLTRDQILFPEEYVDTRQEPQPQGAAQALAA